MERESRNLLRCHSPFQLMALRLGVTKIKISPGTPNRSLYLRQAIPQRPKMMDAGATESAPRNRLARGSSKGCRHRTPSM